jgi:hypothetical protein
MLVFLRSLRLWCAVLLIKCKCKWALLFFLGGGAIQATSVRFAQVIELKCRESDVFQTLRFTDEFNSNDLP